MAQAPIQAAGRPGSALLILVSIFGTAAMLRISLGPALIEPTTVPLDAADLSRWSPAPVATMDRPAVAAKPAATQPLRGIQMVSVTPIEVLPIASANETPRPTVEVAEAIAPAAALMTSEQPLLLSTSNAQLASYVPPIVPSTVSVGSTTSVPQPFSALGSAFVKTGELISLAFKKTGQGIMAPF